MSKVKKSAGVRVSSTSGGDTASNPATQAVSARIDGQQVLGPLRLVEKKIGCSPQALQAAVEMLKGRIAVASFSDANLIDCTRATFETLEDDLDTLSTHLRHALSALSDDPKNNTAREVLLLACGSGFDFVRSVAELSMESMEISRRLLARPAAGGPQ